jgi:hypothetical protein
VTVPELSEGKYRVRILDPWTGKTVTKQPLAHKGAPSCHCFAGVSAGCGTENRSTELIGGERHVATVIAANL